MGSQKENIDNINREAREVISFMGALTRPGGLGMWAQKKSNINQNKLPSGNFAATTEVVNKESFSNQANSIR